MTVTVSSPSPNDSGRWLEDIVEHFLRRTDTEYIPQFKTGALDDFDSEITVDFYVKKPFESAGIIHDSFYIECKYQNSEGSVLHKLAAQKDRTHILEKPLVFVVWGDQEGEMAKYLRRMIECNRVPVGMMSVQTLHEAVRWIASEGYRQVARNPFDPKQTTLDF